MPDWDDDDKLVRAILRGDESAGEILYNRYYDYIYKIMYRRTEHQQTTEDLTTEVVIKVFSAFEEYDARGRFQQWLNMIIRNVHIDWLRREGRLTLLEDEGEEVTYRAIHDMVPLPEVELLISERWEIVQRALNTMPHNAERTAFILRDLEEYSLAEVAEALSISENAAKMKAFRGRQKFREILHNIAPDYSYPKPTPLHESEDTPLRESKDAPLRESEDT